jgi:hypothetical protein
MNHRYTLRVSTNIALFIFLCFSIGVLLWIADEFLGWNLLPELFDAYAQLIVVAMGIAAGLAIATSVMCGFALMAEAAASRAEIQNYKTSRKTWKLGGAVAVTALVALLGLNQIDNYRKKQALAYETETHRTQFFNTTQDLNQAMPQIINQLTPELLNAVSSAAVTEEPTSLATFLSAVQPSTSGQPKVSLVVRASTPYRYCRLYLTASDHRNREEGTARYQLEKQFYIGFPTETETQLIEQLFSSTIEPMTGQLEGEVIDNTRPSSWGLLKSNDEPVGLLILQTDARPRYDVFHAGPAVPSGIPTG